MAAKRSKPNNNKKSPHEVDSLVTMCARRVVAFLTPALAATLPPDVYPPLQRHFERDDQIRLFDHVRLWNTDGKVYEEREYKNGMWHGTHVKRHWSGITSEIIHYKENKLHGKWEHFYRSGMQKSVSYYDNGKRCGEWKAWRADGSLMETLEFKDDLMHGKFRTWCCNGTMNVEGQYEENIPVGKWSYWNHFGKPVSGNAITPFDVEINSVLYRLAFV